MSDTSPLIKQTALNLLKERRDAWLRQSQYPSYRYESNTQELDSHTNAEVVAAIRTTVFCKKTGMLVDSRAFELRFNISEAQLLPPLAA